MVSRGWGARTSSSYEVKLKYVRLFFPMICYETYRLTTHMRFNSLTALLYSNPCVTMMILHFLPSVYDLSESNEFLHVREGGSRGGWHLAFTETTYTDPSVRSSFYRLQASVFITAGLRWAGLSTPLQEEGRVDGLPS